MSTATESSPPPEAGTETGVAAETRPPWWKNGWVFGLLVLGVLHLTGTAVHVQAGFQRILLETGLFHPDVIEPGQRLAADADFAVQTRDGEIVTLNGTAGTVRFINFWASWCAPCLAEMPTIVGLQEDLGDEVTFIMVTLDEDPQQAFDYLDSKGYSIEASIPASRIPSTLYKGVVPTTVVVDKLGRIAVHESGMADYNSRRFRTAIRRLMTE